MTDRAEEKQALARRLKAWGAPGSGSLTLAIAAGAGETLAAVGFAFAFAAAIAGLAAGEAAGPALSASALFLVLRAALGWARAQLADAAGQGLTAAARTAVAQSAARNGPRLLDGAGDGERVAQIVDRTALLAGHDALWKPGRAAAVITPLIVATAIFTQSWLAGTLILVSTLMLPVFIWMTASETAALARAQQSSLDALAGAFEARVRMAGTIRAFNGVAREAGTIERAAEELARRTMAILRMAFLSTAVLEFFASVSIAFVAVYVGFKLLGIFPFQTGETLTLREGLAALILAPEFFAPIRQLSALHHARSDAAAAAEALGTLTDRSEAVPTVRLPELDRAPEIAWLDADLARGGTTVLSGISATAEPGEITLLWGRSGSGKTTMLMSLLDLADTVRGEIAVDGAPLAPHRSLAASAAWVGQKPWALEGTIRHNLHLAAPAAADADLLDALETAGLGFLADERGGPDYALGPGRAGLSGGELQRLALARAVAGKARLLLLDEPTAHLDAATEARVLETIRALSPGRTVIIASHSPAVRRIADRVVALEDGPA